MNLPNCAFIFQENKLVRWKLSLCSVKKKKKTQVKEKEKMASDITTVFASVRFAGVKGGKGDVFEKKKKKKENNLPRTSCSCRVVFSVQPK